MTTKRKVTVLYSLWDPRTNAIRYIGITAHPARRLREHRNDPLNSIRSWVNELHILQLEPQMKILKRNLTPRQAANAEIVAIARGRLKGWPLLNVSAGGDGWNLTGVKRPRFSDVWRQRISEAQKGRQLSDEWRRRISKACKGKKKPPCSEETRRRLSESHKSQIPWNKGLRTGEQINHFRPQ